MDWNKKTELCRLANNAEDLKGRTDFLNYAIDNMNEFDEQAWDMFFTGVDIVPEFIDENLDLHKKIYDKWKDLKTDSFRTALRMGYYQNLIEERIL